MRTSLIILSVMLLTACTSQVITNKVAQNDWEGLGKFTAMNGNREQSLEELQQLSQASGNGEVDYEAYQKGYDQALYEYCRPTEASIMGDEGKPITGVCARYPSTAYDGLGTDPRQGYSSE